MIPPLPIRRRFVNRRRGISNIIVVGEISFTRNGFTWIAYGHLLLSRVYAGQIDSREKYLMTFIEWFPDRMIIIINLRVCSVGNSSGSAREIMRRTYTAMVIWTRPIFKKKKNSHRRYNGHGEHVLLSIHLYVSRDIFVPWRDTRTRFYVVCSRVRSTRNLIHCSVIRLTE